MHLAGVVVLGDFIPSLAFLDWGGHCHRMKAVHKVFDAFADKLIDEHVERKRRKKSEEPDIVVVMLDMAESENPEIDVSRIHIKAIILDMLTAATEASATTVEWAMTEPLLVPHESTQGCNVGGYYIPPKTRLFVNAWAMGRDESVWEDALEFKPERFIGSRIDVKGHHFELLPFGT
ncbi:cytochrome P450 71AU50-like [Cryptomeria japonica]|uniref:cytochrome P450 71AU50-like n=1 Tax=Cryptomeria japonica TaxID=3369 RepID=UPI0025ABD4D7|nr:cytochrome P450 71AU50-like [Cryptomeria japonica]